MPKLGFNSIRAAVGAKASAGYQAGMKATSGISKNLPNNAVPLAVIAGAGMGGIYMNNRYGLPGPRGRNGQVVSDRDQNRRIVRNMRAAQRSSAVEGLLPKSSGGYTI
jgi:hypothetical protein